MKPLLKRVYLKKDKVMRGEEKEREEEKKVVRVWLYEIMCVFMLLWLMHLPPFVFVIVFCFYFCFSLLMYRMVMKWKMDGVEY